MALRAARAGAAVLLRAGLPRPGSAAELKSRGDYVTATDGASEVAILEVLAREAPGIAVLAEERGGMRAATMWAVDPLDGTTNFTRGFPSVGISVALLDKGVPVAGVVLAPFFGLEFTVARGQGAFMNGERLRKAKRDILILAPGPINRGVEITPEVADGSHSVILNQVTNGLFIRMACLYLLHHNKNR